jgi:hypothetical protein
MERPADLAPVPAQPFQFTIRSLLWFTLTVAMVLAYIRPTESRHVTNLVVASGAALIAGLAAGAFTKRVFDAIFGAFLGLTLVAIIIAGQPDVDVPSAMGWGMVGAFCGAFAGAISPTRPLLSLSVCAVIGLLLMLGTAPDRRNAWIDVILAPIAAASLSGLYILFTWARARYHTSYGAWAAALVLAVILGNWGSVWLAPILSDLMERR